MAFIFRNKTLLSLEIGPLARVNQSTPISRLAILADRACVQEIVRQKLWQKGSIRVNFYVYVERSLVRCQVIDYKKIWMAIAF